ncbi:MAG: biotin--[acetyl-CoA-carboxylase] ligase [Xanthobacteraceae bacterium]
MQLDPAAAAVGVRLIVHATLASTNAEALACARAGEHGPLWIVAREQSAGRGRRGRQWVSKPGNLYATLLLSDTGAPSGMAQLAFVAALAVHDTLAALAPDLRRRLSLKWPNDVLCDEMKICGILLEGETASAGSVVAVGVGINCAHHPRDTEFPATDLAALGYAVTPEAVLQKLSAMMVGRVEQWNRGAGFAVTRADWLTRASGLGRTIRVRLHDRETIGIFESLDERGHLILSFPDGGFELIPAGDVFPLQAATAERV